ncbi:hypothetical protein AAG570_011626 [Ranatra chinensis]|uniref:Uncharacterized protein n=1 Tax=Ranatra chinensis TaxID=642074 RepID=A0ABD0YL65_9HEMI
MTLVVRTSQLSHTWLFDDVTVSPAPINRTQALPSPVLQSDLPQHSQTIKPSSNDLIPAETSTTPGLNIKRRNTKDATQVSESARSYREHRAISPPSHFTESCKLITDSTLPLREVKRFIWMSHVCPANREYFSLEPVALHDLFRLELCAGVFLKSTVTVDETWMSHYTPENKSQFKQWKHASSPSAKKSWSPPGKSWFLFSLTQKEFSELIFLTQGEIMSAVRYFETLKKLRRD